MAPELRQRQHQAPSDHNYSRMQGLPVHGQAPIIVLGPGGIFNDRVNPSVNDQQETKTKKKRRRRYYGEKNRRYKTKRIIVGKPSTASQGRRRSATVSKGPPEGSADNAKRETVASFSGETKRETPTVPTVMDDAPNDLSDGYRPMIGQKRPGCCSKCGLRIPIKRLKSSRDSLRHSDRLQKKNYKLPFNTLPDVVKLHIFSFLTLKERAAAALVSSDWAQHMRSPRLWNDIDFTVFDAPTQKLKHSPQAKSFQFRWFTTVREYNAYRQRVLEFLGYLRHISPMLEYLRFSYDIAHPKDNWLQVISDFIDNSQCRDLARVDIDWADTPVRPPCVDVFCCLFKKGRVLLTHHMKRVPLFHTLLAKLTRVAINLSNVSIPFDWSARSVLLMCRLRELRVVHLRKYVLMRTLQQSLVDLLLAHLPHLTHLTLEMCMPAYSSRQLYTLSHPHLQVLDTSQCQGFFLKKVDLPQLHTLHIGHMSWKGPLVATRENNTIPCLYEILKVGAPKLTMVNKHRVQAYWLDFMYEELDTVLERMCPCKDHTLNWTS